MEVRAFFPGTIQLFGNIIVSGCFRCKNGLQWVCLCVRTVYTVYNPTWEFEIWFQHIYSLARLHFKLNRKDFNSELNKKKNPDLNSKEMFAIIHSAVHFSEKQNF